MALPPQDDVPGLLRGLSLCAGVGGLDLGLAIAEPGFRTVGYVERDSFAAAVLVARMADQALCDAPVWDDLVSFDGRPWRGAVDIVLAGYPCQPFSSAGNRMGEDDPRHLWPHVRRIVCETGARRVFLENVEGHVSLGFDSVRSDLAAMGFRVRAALFSAAEAGAAHWRRRLFVLADADRTDVCEPAGDWHLRNRLDPAHIALPGGQAGRHQGGGDSLDTALAGKQSHGSDLYGTGDLCLFAPAPSDGARWEQALRQRPDLEPAVHRLDHGLAYRLDQPRAAGNGVCSLAAAIAYRTLDAAFNAA